MVRLFKHYVPHAVLLLGLIDCVLLLIAGDLAWSLRAAQIGMDPGSLVERSGLLGGFAVIVLAAMTAVGVYGSEALRSLRFAGARLLVAVSLAIIALAFVDFVLPGSMFWRSTLLYAMVLSIALLVINRTIVGGILGASAFRRRVLVLGAGARAVRLRELADRPSSGFVIIGYVGMTGIATGPHLYYELLVDGRQIDPEGQALKDAVRRQQLQLPQTASVPLP